MDVVCVEKVDGRDNVGVVGLYWHLEGEVEATTTTYLHKTSPTCVDEIGVMMQIEEAAT